jgi:flagellar protein FlgJ
MADDPLILPPAVAAATQRAAPRVAMGGDSATVGKTAEDFEAFFLSQVFENMFAGVGTDNMFGGGQGETVYRSLLLQEYGKVTARSGGVGIADAVKREILQAQENKQVKT